MTFNACVTAVKKSQWTWRFYDVLELWSIVKKFAIVIEFSYNSIPCNMKYDLVTKQKAIKKDEMGNIN